MAQAVAGASVPPRLVQAVERALSKKPTERQRSAGAFAGDLAWILHHDLGRAQAAILDIRYPSGATRKHMVLPGVHCIGVGTGCEVSLASDDTARIFAVIEWSGSPHEAELWPVEDGSVYVNGHRLGHRVRLVPGTYMDIGAFHLQLRYP